MFALAAGAAGSSVAALKPVTAGVRLHRNASKRGDLIFCSDGRAPDRAKTRRFVFWSDGWAAFDGTNGAERYVSHYSPQVADPRAPATLSTGVIIIGGRMVRMERRGP